MKGTKTGGREKGTPNKLTRDFAEKYDELTEEHEDPLKVLFKMLSDTEADRHIKVKAASELLSYRYAKCRAVEVTNNVVNKPAREMTTEELKAIVAAGEGQ